MIQAGKLRHKITIQQSTTAVNGIGEKTDTWTTFATRRAEVTNNIGSELQNSDQVKGKRAVVFILRYLSGVSIQMRVSWDSRVFDIVDVDNVKGLNVKTVLTCVERI